MNSIVLRVSLFAALNLAVIGCGPGAGVYCQSGPKYGTQCYSEADVRNPPGQSHTPPDPPRKGEPPATPPPNQVKW